MRFSDKWQMFILYSNNNLCIHYSSQESSHRVDENPHQGQQDRDV